MLLHHVHGPLPHLGIDRLHGGRHGGGQGGFGLGLMGLLQLAVDVRQDLMDRRRGLHDGGLVHLGHDLSGGDEIAVADTDGGDLDGSRYLHRHGLLLRQGTGGLDTADESLLLHRARDDAHLSHGPILHGLLLGSREQEHHQAQGEEQQHTGRPQGHPAQGTGSFLLRLLLTELFAEEYESHDAEDHAQGGAHQDVQPVWLHRLLDGRPGRQRQILSQLIDLVR